jgi:hypothetical protein
MARYKDGAPKVLYAIVYQDSGEAVTYDKAKERNEDFAHDKGVRHVVTATYALVSTKNHPVKDGA